MRQYENQKTGLGKFVLIGIGARGTYFFPKTNTSYITREMAEAFAVEEKTKYPAHHYFVTSIVGEVLEVPQPRYALKEWD